MSELNQNSANSEHPLPPEVHGQAPAAPPVESERGPEAPITGWKRVRFLFKVVEIRLRFILILFVTFVLIGKWDTIKNYWDKFTRPSGEQAAIVSDVEYFCPMHPSVVRKSLDPDGSIPKCPICSMPLSKRTKAAHGANTALPAGVTARVQLSPERIQMAGLTTVEVAYHPLAKELRTVGFVAYDQSRLSQITTRVSGYLTKLYVDRSFQQVAAGEPLALIYSPDLYSTEQDLILALDRDATDLAQAGKDRLKLLGIDQNEIDALIATQKLLVAVKGGDKSQIEQARQTLSQLARTEAEIDRVVAARKADSGLLVRSPVGGHVISKNVELGAHVEVGATLFEIADLSDVWVEAEVFAADLSLLHAGQMAEINVEGLPNEVFRGKVVLVHPHIEATTRTNRVRIELPNTGHRLSPGMYATVTFSTPFEELEPYKSELAAFRKGPAGTDDTSLIAFQKTCPVTGNKLGVMGTPIKRQAGGKTVFLCCSACIEEFDKRKDHYLAALSPPPENGVLTVPERSVVDTGTKKVVYLERTSGVFDGVEVQLGPLSGDSYPVIKGLALGDRVADAGAFLIDAETRLNPTAGTYIGASGGSSGTTASTRAAQADSASTHPIEIPAGLVLNKPDAEALANLDSLSPADRSAALDQQVCPITHAALGSMGVPVKVELAPGVTAFLCCDNCREEAKKDPQKVLRKLAAVRQAVKDQAPHK